MDSAEAPRLVAGVVQPGISSSIVAHGPAISGDSRWSDHGLPIVLPSLRGRPSRRSKLECRADAVVSAIRLGRHRLEFWSRSERKNPSYSWSGECSAGNQELGADLSSAP